MVRRQRTVVAHEGAEKPVFWLESLESCERASVRDGCNWGAAIARIASHRRAAGRYCRSLLRSNSRSRCSLCGLPTASDCVLHTKLRSIKDGVSFTLPQPQTSPRRMGSPRLVLPRIATFFAWRTLIRGRPLGPSARNMSAAVHGLMVVMVSPDDLTVTRPASR